MSAQREGIRLTANGCESPVLTRSAAKRAASRSASLRFQFGIVYILLAAVICSSRYCQLHTSYARLDEAIVPYALLGLALILVIMGVINVSIFVAAKFFSPCVEITTAQKELLGIRDNDNGFHVSPEKKEGRASSVPSVTFSPSSMSSHFHHVPLGSSGHGSFLSSPGSSVLSSTLPFGSQLATPSSLDTTVSSSFTYVKPSNISPASVRPFSLEDNGSPSFLRRRASSSRQSPAGRNDHISNLEELDSFLEEQEIKEQQEQLARSDIGSGTNTSFWSYARTAADYIPQLRKYQYQLAPRSPQSKVTQSDDDPGHHSKCSADEMWASLGVSMDTLDAWTENLRYWLSQTIVLKLVKEIDHVNKDLARLGSEDQQIGEVGVSLLRTIAISKGQFVPSLNAIIPYLEITINQDYLVHRLRELAKDGCMADFNWKGGSEFRGKAWDEHLPTDAAIVMHLLCTYMDSRMPVNPKYPDGKSFTAQHFMKTPAKPNFAVKKDNLCLYQTKESPPHFKVIIGSDIWDVSKGRSNMFHAVLRFLHHVKVNQNGMLGHVHLGLSGINILGVLTGCGTAR